MAYDEYVAAAVAAGRAYDDLPAPIKAAVSAAEYKQRCVGVVVVVVSKGLSALTTAQVHVDCCTRLVLP